jgi:hypothetical protein
MAVTFVNIIQGVAKVLTTSETGMILFTNDEKAR